MGVDGIYRIIYLIWHHDGPTSWVFLVNYQVLSFCPLLETFSY
jgi:hypothetical protein